MTKEYSSGKVVEMIEEKQESARAQIQVLKELKNRDFEIPEVVVVGEDGEEKDLEFGVLFYINTEYKTVNWTWTVSEDKIPGKEITSLIRQLAKQNYKVDYRNTSEYALTIQFTQRGEEVKEIMIDEETYWLSERISFNSYYSLVEEENKCKIVLMEETERVVKERKYKLVCPGEEEATE